MSTSFSRYKLLAVTVFLVAFSYFQQASAKQDWIQLFNGRDMQGWVVKIAGHEPGDNYKNTFRVENGVLKVAYDQYEKFDNKFGHLIYEEPFSNYIIRVEYRFLGEQVPGGESWAFRNSGIMVHGQSPESMGKYQNFPVSIEVQLLGGDGHLERTNGNLCTPGTHVVMDGELVTTHCISSSSQTYHGDQWVTLEAEVRGGRIIRHIVNGDTVLTYSQPQLDDSDKDAQKLIKSDDLILRSGYISLQAESHPLEFRKVELRVLED